MIVHDHDVIGSDVSPMRTCSTTHWLAWLLHKKHWAMAERWIGMVDHPTLTFADGQANDHFRISMVHFPSFFPQFSKQDGKASF